MHIDDSIPCFIINFVMLLQYFHMSASISIILAQIMLVESKESAHLVAIHGS